MNTQEEQVGGCWPTEMHKWLLRAALLDADIARDAWDQWSNKIDFENMDHASERLIPLLNNNLQRLKITHPLSGRFQGLYRQSWIRGNFLSQTGTDVLSGLRACEIQTLLLKGSAYSVLYYESQGLRPMADLDIMVPIKKAQAALDYLLANGWRVTTKNFYGLSDDYLCNHNGVALKQKGRGEIDLHWHALHECLAVDDDDGFWQSSKEITAHGVQTKTLSDADHLLHCCVHGLRWNSLPPIRWVADAHMIISKSADLDWDLLVERSTRMELVLTLRNALHYLVDTVDSPVPLSALERLDSIKVSRDQEREFQIKTHDRGPMGRLPSIICLYKRQYKTDQNVLLRSISLANYVKRYWLAEGERTLLSALVRKTVRLFNAGFKYKGHS